MTRRNIGIILLAALLIAMGTVLIGVNFFGWHLQWFAGWWTLPIIAAAIVSLVVNRPNFFNGMMLGTGILLLVRMQNWEGVRETITWRQFWAAEVALALLLLGVSLLVRMLVPRKTPPVVVGAFVPPQPVEPGTYTPPFDANAAADSGPATGEAFPTRFAIFTGEACRSDCRQLKGGRFSAIFGSVNVNLAAADFQQPITIETNTLFGGVDIITPPGVRVECNGTSIFGGCDAKAITGRPYDPSHPHLTIRYLNVFGGTNVK
jgi:hypothetical protein